MVRQTPTKQFMTKEQILKFINESMQNEIKWESIRGIGGEPTLHSDINNIIRILNDYKRRYSNNTRITIVSNGSGEYVKKSDELEELYDVKTENSNKKQIFNRHFGQQIKLLLILNSKQYGFFKKLQDDNNIWLIRYERILSVLHSSYCKNDIGRLVKKKVTLKR